MENNMNEQTSAGRKMLHWACCVLPTASLLMWLASIVALILSWVSVMNVEGAIWGYGPQWWIWNAVMFGILALYGGSRKMGGHKGMCGCKPDCNCKDGVCVCH
jgi:hypothetical protein